MAIQGILQDIFGWRRQSGTLIKVQGPLGVGTMFSTFCENGNLQGLHFLYAYRNALRMTSRLTYLTPVLDVVLCLVATAENFCGNDCISLTMIVAS